MQKLNGKQRKHLRGLGHHLEPLVMVGKEGISEAVTKAVDRALIDHELVKVRLLESCPDDRGTCAEKLAAATSSECVGEIGRTLLLYRRHPKKPKIVLPEVGA